MIDHIESNSIKLHLLTTLSNDEDSKTSENSNPTINMTSNRLNDGNSSSTETAVDTHPCVPLNILSPPKKNTNPIQSTLSSHLSSLRNTSSNSLGSALYATSNGSSDKLQLSTSPQSPSAKKLLSKIVLGTFSKSSDSESNSSSPESISIMKLIKRRSKSNASSTSLSSFTTGHPIVPSLSNELIFDIDDYSSLNKISKKIIPDVLLNHGLSMLRVNHKKKTRRHFRIDFENLLLTWTKSDPLNNNISIGKVSSLSFDKIKSIRVKKDASNYREEFHISNDFEKSWCSIIYLSDKNKLKGLHVIADTEPDFQIFFNTVTAFTNYRQKLIKNFLVGIDDLKNFKDLILEDSTVSTKQSKQALNFQDILKYSKRLHINISKKHLLEIFNQIDLDHNNYLTFEQFKEFMKLLKKRQDVETIFKKLISGANKRKLYFHDFKNFIINIQKEIYDEDYLWKLFGKFAIKNGCDEEPETRENLYLNVEEFNNYLLSKYSPFLKTLGNDYTRPINEYFISSSHNTYLLGRQIAGESSIEVYIKALQRGCRCIEIDIWDGSGDKEGEPVVCHGRTFTSSIDLKSVAQVIRKHAFITTPYPLIISLEVHCNYSNQLKIIEVMKEVFGDILVVIPFNDFAPFLPSPLDLKHKVLLKVKKSSPYYIEAGGSTFSSSGTGTFTSNTSSFSEDNSTGSKSFSIKRKRLSDRKISDELASLGVYLQGIKFRNFSLPESKTYNHCFSFGEKTVDSMLKDPTKKSSIYKHNRKFLMRVYPSQYRVNSSNFSPLKYWDIGTQMVATNWQTYDLGQQINEAMFEVNDRTGYILKPDYLRLPFNKDPKNSISHLKFRRYKISLEIISAHQLHKPKDFKNDELISPYVTFEVLGDENCILEQSIAKTPIVVENGFNPIWNFKLNGVFQTKNSFVFGKFLVKTGDSIIGLNVVKLDYMNQGYRYVPLNDTNGEELIYSTLFIRIDYHEIY